MKDYVQSDFIPEEHDKYNLGSDNLRWDSLYLSSNALHIGTMNIHVEDDTMYLDGYNLQTSNFYTSNVYTSNIYTENSISTDIYNSNIFTTNITSKLIQSCNIIPYMNSNCDLGEHVNKWNNLYAYNMFGTHYVDSDERDYHETESNMINHSYISNYLSTQLHAPPTSLDYIMRIPIYKYKKKWDLEDTFEHNINNNTSSNIGIKASDLESIIPNAITYRTSYIPNINIYVNPGSFISGSPNEYTLHIPGTNTDWHTIFGAINVDVTLKKQILLIHPNGDRYYVEAKDLPSKSAGGNNLTVYSSNILPQSSASWMAYGTLTSEYESINYHEILNHLIIAFQEKNK